MELRPLKRKDAPLMLEWMRDENIIRFFCFDASGSDLESTNEFIDSSISDKTDVHFAVVNDEDEYMGTVSLKNIDSVNMHGEYAIALRKTAQGKGYAKFATEAILRYAFQKIGLNKVYLNVLSYNKRAIAFYEKIGFKFEGEFKKHIKKDDKFHDIKWYSVLSEDFR